MDIYRNVYISSCAQILRSTNGYPMHLEILPTFIHSQGQFRCRPPTDFFISFVCLGIANYHQFVVCIYKEFSLYY